jgi:hypothetical protein
LLDEEAGTASGGSGGSPCLEALSAEDRAALCGTERNGSLLSASRAGGLGLDLCVAVGLSRHRRCAEHSNPFGFAGFAAFGFVFELLIVKEKLFPSRENEIIPTVNTLEHLVLKFH